MSAPQGSAPLIVAWEELTCSLMGATRRFSASFRHNLAHYINRELLDGLVMVATLEFERADQRLERLKALDQRVATLKILLRQAHKQRALDHGLYDLHSEALIKIGRMIGGWRKHLEQRVERG